MNEQETILFCRSKDMPVMCLNMQTTCEFGVGTNPGSQFTLSVRIQEAEKNTCHLNQSII